MLQTLLIACVPSVLTFGIGLVVGYGRATARLAVMETQITALQTAVDRLENMWLNSR